MIGPAAFWAALRRSITTEQKALSEKLCSGAFADFAEAKSLSSRIEALGWVLHEAARINGELSIPKVQTEEETVF